MKIAKPTQLTPETFDLKEGSISFQKDRIVIEDNEKVTVWLRLFSAVAGMSYGFVSFLRFQDTGESLLLWSGL
jgi:hypothetical protein